MHSTVTKCSLNSLNLEMTFPIGAIMRGRAYRHQPGYDPTQNDSRKTRLAWKLQINHAIYSLLVTAQS